MSLDDRIGCAPQLVTACVALAVAIASSVHANRENKKQSGQIRPKHSETSHFITERAVFVNSGAER